MVPSVTEALKTKPGLQARSPTLNWFMTVKYFLNILFFILSGGAAHAADVVFREVFPSGRGPSRDSFHLVVEDSAYTHGAESILIELAHQESHQLRISLFRAPCSAALEGREALVTSEWEVVIGEGPMAQGLLLRSWKMHAGTHDPGQLLALYANRFASHLPRLQKIFLASDSGDDLAAQAFAQLLREYLRNPLRPNHAAADKWAREIFRE